MEMHFKRTNGWHSAASTQMKNPLFRDASHMEISCVALTATPHNRPSDSVTLLRAPLQSIQARGKHSKGKCRFL